MNFDQSLERLQTICSIAACVAIVGACAVLVSPASVPTSPLKARTSGDCLVLSGSGIPHGFAVCGEARPVSGD